VRGVCFRRKSNTEAQLWPDRFPRKKRPTALTSKPGKIIGGAHAVAVQVNPSATVHTNPWAWPRKNSAPPKQSKSGYAAANQAPTSRFATDRIKRSDRKSLGEILFQSVCADPNLTLIWSRATKVCRHPVSTTVPFITEVCSRNSLRGRSGFLLRPRS
jgi:hypothetical protein